MRPSTTQAVRNNAEWCATVCGARGRPGTFSEHLWVGDQPPPYYPDIITLAPASPARDAALREAIDRHRSHGARQLSVKDSFGDADLAPAGCSVLFEARWFGRPGTRAIRTARGGGEQWTVVRRDEDLAAWRKAWDAKIVDTDPVFAPALLQEEDVVFIAARGGRDIVAGAAINRHAGAVGVSNFFSHAANAAAHWSECVSIAMARFPGLPVVGYAPGAELAGALATGFDALGPLRVWVAK